MTVFELLCLWIGCFGGKLLLFSCMSVFRGSFTGHNGCYHSNIIVTLWSPHANSGNIYSPSSIRVVIKFLVSGNYTNFSNLSRNIYDKVLGNLWNFMRYEQGSYSECELSKWHFCPVLRTTGMVFRGWGLDISLHNLHPSCPRKFHPLSASWHTPVTSTLVFKWVSLNW